ncbi:MAG: sulfotransferase [Gallionella sp.]|nr:sulfotransferase [Gallionella sp.]
MIALYKAGRYAELENQARLFLQRYPDSGFGWKILSAALSLQGKDPLHALQQTARLLPQDAEVLNNLGDALAKRELLSEAEPYFRRAISLKPQYEDALHNLGVVLIQLGKIDEAENCFLKVLTINSDCVEARYFIAQNKKAKIADENLRALAAIDQRVQQQSLALPTKDQIFLHFALGKSYDNIKEAGSAFPHYAQGTRMKRQTYQYDPSIDTRNIEGLIRIFDAETLNRLRGNGNPSERPIFIVGMPRSGTTLTEQIIASHPDVHGAGELTDLLTITQRNISGVAYPSSILRLDRSMLDVWAAEYLIAISRDNPGAKRITDKLPANFMAIGLIHLMLPNAKIIHVNRNPMDTCLSCFTMLFKDNHVPWSYDLQELGAFYSGYARLMDHWRRVLPKGTFLDIHYEEIVQDRETQARRLIEYCGLEWNDRCLESHKTERTVRTASLLQVREPVYTSSVERWRCYEKELSPLMTALGEHVAGY